MTSNHKTLAIVLIVIIVISLVVLPTGTPEDIITTAPILGAIGWKKFFILSMILLVFLIIAISIIRNKADVKSYVKNIIGNIGVKSSIIK